MTTEDIRDLLECAPEDCEVLTYNNVTHEYVPIKSLTVRGNKILINPE